jgi:DNA helicase TIP49 (TBP-interacting protein)
MVKIPLNRQETDVTPVQLERIGPHSHVKGLGLNYLLQIC